MPDFEEKLLKLIFGYLSDFSIRKVSEMAGLKYDGGTEVVKKLLINNHSSFEKECKFTIAGRKDNTLEIIISHPGMQDAKCEDAHSLEYIGFGKGIGKSKTTYKNNNTELNFEINPKENEYNFKIEIYFDKKVYRQAAKLHRLKTGQK